MSVVIPTRGRPHLVVRAVESVQAQTRTVEEIVVVVDGHDPETVGALEALAEPRLTIVQHDVSRGAAAARNSGVGTSTQPWVALLDDDDVWLPAKVERQWARLADGGQHDARPGEDPALVLSCGVRWERGSRTEVWPLRAPRIGEPLGEYLFSRKEAGEGFLATPTLMLPRALAVKCPMPEALRVHEDLDWMLDLEVAGARFDVVLEPLVVVDGRPARDSLSGQGRWQSSLAWALGRREQLGPRGFSGFCLTEVARAFRGGHRVLPAAAVLALALTGSPRAKDLAVFAGIVLLPEQLRWRARDLVRRVRR